MNWLSLIFLALRYLPDLVKLVREIIGIIQKTKDPTISRMQMRELRRGLRAATDLGDYSGLEAMLEDLREKEKRG
jgi:hypothetical protein